MRAPSLYPDIKQDLKTIAKAVIEEEDQFLDQRWLEIKDQIRELAESCKATMAERKRRDREGD